MKRFFSILLVLFGLSQNFVAAQSCTFEPKVLYAECHNALLAVTECSDCQQYCWSNGTLGQFNQVSVSGVYTVTVTCSGGNTAVANLTVDVDSQCPQLCSSEISVTNKCGYSTLEALCITGDCANFYWSNGMTGKIINVTSSGPYNVTVTSSTGSCTSVSNAQVSIKNGPSVYIDPNNLALCEGESVSLRATATSTCSYVWSNGMMGNIISVNKAGLYTVTVTDVNGCTATSQANVVQLQKTATPTLSANIVGESVIVTSSPSTYYSWNNNAMTQSVTINTSSVLAVKVKDSGKCWSDYSCPVPVVIKTTVVEKIVEVVVVKEIPVYVDTCIWENPDVVECDTTGIVASNGMHYGDTMEEIIPSGLSGNTIVKLLAPSLGNVEYKWSGGIYAGNNNIWINTTVIPPTNIYRLDIYSKNSAKDFLGCYEFKYHVTKGSGFTTGTEEESEIREKKDFGVYPNPTSEDFNLKFPSNVSPGVYFLNILDSQGKIIGNERLIKQ